MAAALFCIISSPTSVFSFDQCLPVLLELPLRIQCTSTLGSHRNGRWTVCSPTLSRGKRTQGSGLGVDPHAGARPPRVASETVAVTLAQVAALKPGNIAASSLF